MKEICRWVICFVFIVSACSSGPGGTKSPCSVGAACNDGDPCTSNDICIAEGECAGAAWENSDPCLECSCDPTTGVACLAVTPGTVCDDGECCTQSDSCQLCEGDGCPDHGLSCVGKPKFCTSGEPCKASVCSCNEFDAPECRAEDLEDGSECDFDPNDCTQGDSCLAGFCVKGDPIPLDDNNPCTKDACVKGEIVHSPSVEGQCDDGDLCTEFDSCYLGNCVGGDLVKCKVFECAGSASCVEGGCVVEWKPVGAACDDGNPCTKDDACDAEHQCTSTGKNCSDANPCTVDTCDPLLGCNNEVSQAANGVACGLGEACDGLGVCDSGICTDIEGPACDDNNPCTDDECQAEVGCVHLPNAQACNDGDPCTATDSCAGGSCVGSGVGEGLNVNCTQKNSIDDGKCCCFAKDPTGKYKSAHVLDLGAVFKNDSVTCCLTPGFNVGCKDTAKFDVSLDGKTWTNLFTVPTTSAKNAAGAWVPVCQALQSATGFQFVRGGNSKCYVDHFKCSQLCDAVSCTAATPEVCDDNNPCTTDSCDAESGQCTHQPIVSPTCLVLHGGSNLVSFSHLPEDPTLAAVFGAHLPLLNFIFTEGRMSKRLSNGALAGNLERLERDAGYWVNVKSPPGSNWLAISLPGEATDPDLNYTLHAGVNMISFAGPQAAPLPAAMGPPDQDVYEGWIGEGIALFYMNGKWVGSLTSLVVNDGYEVIVNGAKTLNLNCPDCDGAAPYTYGCRSSFATNYNAAAQIGDGSCAYDVPAGWTMPNFGSGAKNQIFVLVHKLGNTNVVGSFAAGKSRGFGYKYGEFTVAPVIDAPLGAPITLRQYNAAQKKESTITLNAELILPLNGVVVVGCDQPGAPNYSALATVSANICN